MNGNIKHLTLVKNQSMQNFIDNCKRVIDEYQDKNLYVDVQYSTPYEETFHRHEYSALIIGRENS